MIDDTDRQDDADPDDLVARARTERDAFGRLYELTHGMIYRYCRRRIADRATAEDVCAAVFVAIAEQIGDFPGDTLTDFRRWAFGVARNQTASTQRKRQRRGHLLRLASENGRLAKPAESGPALESDNEALHEALAALSEREQTLIDLRYTEGLSHDEIARVVGARGGAVRTALSRALNKLRARLAPQPEATRGRP